MIIDQNRSNTTKADIFYSNNKISIYNTYDIALSHSNFKGVVFSYLQIALC